MNSLYGVGYEPIGDLVDFIDPFGIRKIPGAVAGKVADKSANWVDTRSARAASAATVGAERVVKDAGKTALVAVAGSVALVGVLAGGFLLYRRAQKQSDEGTR